MDQTSRDNAVPVHQGRFGLSLLNSLIGDYLEKENNPLAVQMGFYYRSQKLSLDQPLDGQLDFPLGKRIVIFVHGLTNMENVWDYPPEGTTTRSIVGHYIDVCFDAAPDVTEKSYGKQLQEQFGYTPFYLRYNAGLSMEKNGRSFSNLISQLLAAYPVEIEELVLVGYGMGGRLIGQAQYWADKGEKEWLPLLGKCIYLGNLKEGSLLALIFQLSSTLIRRIPVFHSHALADWLDARGKHIQSRNQGGRSRDASENRIAGAAVLFDERARHYFVAGDLVKKGRSDQSVDRHEVSPQANAAIPLFAPSHSQSTYIEGVSPVRLTHTDEVYALIAKWLHAEAGDRTDHHLTMNSGASDYEQDITLPSSATFNNLLIAGTVDLLASAYDKTVETIETVHYSVAEEPFYALDKVPFVSQIAKPVESAQRDILDAWYRSLRNRGRMMHQYAADLAQLNDAANDGKGNAANQRVDAV